MVVERSSSWGRFELKLIRREAAAGLIEKEVIRNRLRDFEGKLTRHNHFDALTHIDDALNRVSPEFADEDRCRFMALCFGYFLTMHREMEFSGGIIHRFLLWELHHNGLTDVMQFMLGNQSVRFLKVGFCLITGLRFGFVPDTTKYAAVENGIHQRYFPRAEEVSLEEIRGVFTVAEFGEAYDAVNLCLIYMMNWILIGLDERFKIPVWKFRVVEDLDVFDTFLWEEDRLHIPPPVLDQTTFGRNSGIEGGGLTDRTSDSEGSELTVRGLRPSQTLNEKGIGIGIGGFSLPPPDMVHLQGIPVGALDVMERYVENKV
ncbi:hypothetical protein Ddye_016222 [Dipteronia dyeriana]|uniref:DUF1985 domain-containing protein n=1 Tax=Dipteronia dyeriana TaxID=168575 RepID=A0AAD9U703_9ROSI|nr:hypothetical protein Ddye_016222 [Dipteronia dyeriana]